MPSPNPSLSLFSLWDQCSEYMVDELPPQQFNTWIKPLVVLHGECNTQDAPNETLVLEAPNRFIKDWVSEKFQPRLEEFARMFSGGAINSVKLDVAQQEFPGFLQQAQSQPAVNGSLYDASNIIESNKPSPAYERQLTGEPGQQSQTQSADARERNAALIAKQKAKKASNLRDFSEELNLGTPKLSFESSDAAFLNSVAHTNANIDGNFSDDWSATEFKNETIPEDLLRAEPFTNDLPNDVKASPGSSYSNSIIGRYRFDNFVEGKSNQLARAAAIQVVENPSGSYNPLFIYGDVGLGKTHLMHAVGNEIKRRNPHAKVVYLHAERFVGDMVKAIQLNAISDFKRYYRSVDALLIDDIQFFAKKEHSQEEFFHTFNALLEGGHQMIFSCDRLPKSITGVEERLKSRFGWGLTVQIDAPELETRVAILKRKAEQEGIAIPNEAAFFLAKKVRANVRELEGALKRVNATADFLKAPITIDLIKESLKDILALQDKMVSIDNIQRTVAEYFKIKISDLNSKRRNRSVARPRQMAMVLAKELTNHSLPEIGEAFGGRDHTTVLHACRKIKDLRDSDNEVSQDYHNLFRLISS